MNAPKVLIRHAASKSSGLDAEGRREKRPRVRAAGLKNDCPRRPRTSPQNSRARRWSWQPCPVRLGAGAKRGNHGRGKVDRGLSLGALLADKAYDAEPFRDLLKSKGVEPV